MVTTSAMKGARFRFYSELNDFLPDDKCQVEFVHRFSGRPSVKDTIESLGIPHGEVDLVLLNGESAHFSSLLSDGDRVSVYPRFRSIDVAPISLVRPPPLPEARFVLDVHLGRLAVYLRLLGFDTVWRNEIGDAELAAISSSEGRILLSRDRGLLMRSRVTHGAWLRSAQPRQQLIEVLQRFGLATSIVPFRLCLRCNYPLEIIEKGTIADRLPPRIRALHQDFRICRHCQRIYWKGSHHAQMQHLVSQVIADAATGPRLSDFGARKLSRVNG